jgi:hypothetical protein
MGIASKTLPVIEEHTISARTEIECDGVGGVEKYVKQTGPLLGPLFFLYILSA